jgi:hypothetical protein
MGSPLRRMAAAAAALPGTGVLPRWLGWVGAALG